MENSKTLTMQSIIEGLRDCPDCLFDALANYGHELSKSELVDLCKELLYAINHELWARDADDVYACAADELAERYEEE